MFGANKVRNAVGLAKDWALGAWDSLSTTTRQPNCVIGHVDDPEWPKIVADIKAERKMQSLYGVPERYQLEFYHLHCNDASQAATLLAAGYTPEALIAQGFDEMTLVWLGEFAAEHPSDDDQTYRHAFKAYASRYQFIQSLEPRPVIRTTSVAEGGDASAGYHSSTSGQESDDENNGLPSAADADENTRRRLLIAAANDDISSVDENTRRRLLRAAEDEKDSTLTTTTFGEGDDDFSEFEPH